MQERSPAVPLEDLDVAVAREEAEEQLLNTTLQSLFGTLSMCEPDDDGRILDISVYASGDQGPSLSNLTMRLDLTPVENRQGQDVKSLGLSPVVAIPIQPPRD